MADQHIITSSLTPAEARALVTDIQTGLNDIAQRLLRLYEGQGWVALGYASWRECISTEFNFPSSRAYRLLALAQVQENLSPMGENIAINERQARLLAPLSPDEQRAVHQQALDSAPDGKLTAAHIERVIDDRQALRDAEKQINEALGHARAGVAALSEVRALLEPKGLYESWCEAEFGMTPDELLAELDLEAADTLE